MYKLSVNDKTLKKIVKFTPSDQKKIYKTFKELEQDPFPQGKDLKKLAGSTFPLWRIRIGDLRIVYELSSQEKIVRIIKIDYRGNIY